MLDRFSGWIITVAVAGCWRRHFGARHVDAGSVARGFRAGTAAAAENALGRTRSAGHLDR